jgi:peptidoglycan/LPS O-acetylase OafA/YrhL
MVGVVCRRFVTNLSNSCQFPFASDFTSSHNAMLSLKLSPMTPLATTKSLTRGRIPSLDGMRGTCILLVLASHTVGSSNFPRFNFVSGLAAIGLVVFFVLSGFLITTVLMREQGRTGAISLKNFYIRRFLRIFPVAYLYITVVALLSFLGIIGLRPHDLAFAVSYLMDFHHDRAWYLGHLWYLTVEEQFYLLWPAIITIFGFRKGFFLAFAGLAFVPFSRITISRLFPTASPSFDVPGGTASILTGCVLALSFQWMTSKRVFTSNVFLLALLGAVAVRLYTWNHGYPAHGLSYVINILVALAVFRCIAVPDDRLGRILNSKALMFVGGLSYSIYVWQQLFLPPMPPGSSFPLNLLAALATALCSYYLIERPCLNLKKRFTRTKFGPPAEVPAAVLTDRIA